MKALRILSALAACVALTMVVGCSGSGGGEEEGAGGATNTTESSGGANGEEAPAPGGTDGMDIE